MMDALIDGAGPGFGLISAIVAIYAIKFFRDWFRPAETPARSDARIPDDERRLLGDDWRNHLR